MLEDDQPQLEERPADPSRASDLEGLSEEEVIIFSSPRYYRLIFSELKPETKNGDLLSALNELKQWKFLTLDADWDKIKLTKKGNQYKKLIKKLMDIEALKVPQSNGLFDYRTEPGRKAILELIKFFMAKLNFDQYFQYLDLPIFEQQPDQLEKDNKDWAELFGSKSLAEIDFNSEEGKNNLFNFLKKRSRKNIRTSRTINKTITTQLNQLTFNPSMIKKILKKAGLNRPEPLFFHLNTSIPKVFEIHERQFNVYLPELKEIQKVLEDNILNFRMDNNRWFTDYLAIMDLPTELFGIHLSDISFATKEVDAFLNLALMGPKIFASQFSSVRDLGELNLIIFPINPKESIAISCKELDMLYYFTLPTEQCRICSNNTLYSYPDFPDSFLVSQKRIGKVLTKNHTIDDFQKEMRKLEEKKGDEKKTEGSKIEQSTLEIQMKTREELLENQYKTLAQLAVLFFNLCTLISQKFTPNFQIPRCFCTFTHGLISFTNFYASDALLISIAPGEVQFGQELQKLMRKISESMEEILDRAANASEK